jgi:hypothetical protein
MSAKATAARARREQWFTTGGREFLLRRPRDAESLEWMQESKWQLALNAVVDWRGVTSDDLCGDGSQDAVPFDKDDRDEWLLDRLDLLAPIMGKVKDMILAKREADEEREKNS